MEVFGGDEQGYVLSELARMAGLDNATTHRLLNTLVMLGYVERNDMTRRFTLSLKCLDLGFNSIARTDMRTLARPLLRKLVGPAAEAASLGILDGNEVIYIERIQAGMVRLGVDVRIGYRIPVYSTALGLAILSTMPESEQRNMLNKIALEKLTPSTVTDIDQIIGRLRVINEAGYVVSDQETVAGLRVIAAPVTDIDGIAVAGVSVAVPASGQTREEFEQALRDPLIETAQTLSRGIQASGGF